MNGAMPGRKVPPDSFKLIAKPFRPGAQFISTPGLQNVQELVSQKRLRSAMDGVLGVLDKDPNNQQALSLAMIIFGAVGRTEQVNAEEALSHRYWLDNRLDSIFAVCSHCRVKSWVPDECLYAFEKMSAKNPVGLQCQDCGYILCRNCLQEAAREHPDGVVPCTNCGHFTLGKPVYPTGRLAKQLKRFGRSVQIVLVMREGPIPATTKDVDKLLDRFNPDTIAEDVTITVVPVAQWTDSVGLFGFSQLKQLITQRGFNPETFEMNGEVVTDDDGLRVAIFRASADDSRQTLDVRLAALQAELKAQPSSPGTFLRSLILDHLERVSALYRSDPAYDQSSPLWIRLISSPVLRLTTDTMLEVLGRANENGQHAYKALQIDKLVLIVSAIPATEPVTVRTYLPGGYFAFLEGNNLLAANAENDFAHWILCAQHKQFVIHLNTLPLDHSALPLYDIDLFSEAERTSMNL